MKPLEVPLRDYKGFLKRKEYWDDLCHEWNSTTIEQKLVNLAGFVQMGGNLSEVISEYADNHDSMYRERIQYCVVKYILRLMTAGRSSVNDNSPFVRRIKRLEKDAMVNLLTDQLKVSVKKGICMDRDWKVSESWEIIYDNELTPDELLDEVESPYWGDYASYDRRADDWWNGQKSLW